MERRAYATWKTPIITTDSKVKEVFKTFNVPIKDVWAFVSQPGAETHCYPDIEWVKLDGHGLGSTRTMKFKNSDHSSFERLELFDRDNHALAWRILEPALGAKVCHGHIRLSSVDERTTNVIYTGTAEDWTDTSSKEWLDGFLQHLYRETIDEVERKIQ